jgi:hypothetical protein
MLPYVLPSLTLKNSVFGPQIIQGDSRGKVSCIGSESNGIIGKNVHVNLCLILNGCRDKAV